MEAVAVAARARVRRPRNSRSVRQSLGSIVLGFEIIIVFLGALVLFGLRALPAPVALIGGAAFILLMVVAIRLLSRPVGVWLGWAVQLGVLASGSLVPELFFVGALFGGIWAYCMIVGGRMDRARAEGAA